MQHEPAEALYTLRKELRKKSELGLLSEIEMHRFMRVAREISPTLPDRDAAIASVLAHWHKFQEAEEAVDNMLAKWGESHYTCMQSAMAYANALCYTKALDAAHAAAKLMPGSVNTFRLVEHMAKVAGAFFAARAALDHMKSIGVPESELGYEEVDSETWYLDKLGITDEQVASYYQKHVNVAKSYISNKPNLTTATRKAVEVDPESGECELWIDFCLSVGGAEAAQIEWDMTKLDLEEFPSVVKDHIFIGVKPNGTPQSGMAKAG